MYQQVLKQPLISYGRLTQAWLGDHFGGWSTQTHAPEDGFECACFFSSRQLGYHRINQKSLNM